MQNRRIVDRLIASIGARVDPVVVSNSFVAIFAQLRHGALTSIVPHTFVSLLAGVSDLLAIDLVEPVHVQAVGLVLSDRDPLSPMARALLASFAHADLEDAFGARAGSF
jgi:DNA-binding transcriptional LysR family regulator